MVYINKNDFSIIDKLDRFNRLENDYFECDEFISPAVSLLNKKGYITSFCCSGHPYNQHPLSRFIETISEANNINGEILKIESTSLLNKSEIPSNKLNFPLLVTYRLGMHNSFYISFKGAYEFNKKLPAGFYIGKSKVDGVSPVIRYDFNFMGTAGYYDMLNKVLAVNNLFYNWVESLDNLNEE